MLCKFTENCQLFDSTNRVFYRKKRSFLVCFIENMHASKSSNVTSDSFFNT